MEIVKYKFQAHGDQRGQLAAIETMKDIPFEVKRVYYLYKTAEGVTRGYHAHKSLEQVLICVSGSCVITLDDGQSREQILLNDPGEGLYVSNAMWREMSEFSSDAVLLVLASKYYDESDYIRNYDEFIEYTKKGGKA